LGKNASQHASSPKRDRCAVQGDLSVGDRQRGPAGTGRTLGVATRGQRCDGRCRGSADGRRAYGRRLRWGEEGAAHEGDGAKLLRATDCHCVLRRKKAATPAPRQTEKRRSKPCFVWNTRPSFECFQDVSEVFPSPKTQRRGDSSSNSNSIGGPVAVGRDKKPYRVGKDRGRSEMRPAVLTCAML